MLHETPRPWTGFFGRLETRIGVARWRQLMGFPVAISAILVIFATNSCMVLSTAIGIDLSTLMISPSKWQKAELHFRRRRRRRCPKHEVHVLVDVLQGLNRGSKSSGFVLFLFPWYLLCRTHFFFS